MHKRFLRRTALLLTAMLLLLCCGCDFNTTVITDADSPDTVSDAFFSSLRQKDFEKCDDCLADSATIRVTDNSESGFTDILVDFYLGKLQYQPVGSADISGIKAVRKIRVTTPDKAAFLEWFKSNKYSVEKQYLKENNLSTLDHQNPDDIRKFMNFAVNEYAGSAAMKTTELELRFVLEDNRWLIIGDNELVSAIYGGCSDENQ